MRDVDPPPRHPSEVQVRGLLNFEPTNHAPYGNRNVLWPGPKLWRTEKKVIERSACAARYAFFDPASTREVSEKFIKRSRVNRDDKCAEPPPSGEEAKGASY